jgi:hypothetical protein
MAIGPDLKPIALPGLTYRILQIKHVSVLTKQDSGSYAYVSTQRESTSGEGSLALAPEGTDFSLPTVNPGDYRFELRDPENHVICACPFSIVGKGDTQRSLERDAELEIKLARSNWNSGEQLELSLSAPYTGAGLITIERERVLGWQWFKSPTPATTQSIQVPGGFEGTGYVNVSYVRTLDSPEVFMSPLSYAVQPFTANPDKRKMALELDAPQRVKPGEVLKIGYKSAKPGRVILYAVDEGIHQITDYKLPQPLTHFFRKRALETETEQLLDLILPEFSLLNRKAFGGDEDEAMKLNLNPFKRRKEAPVVYWSGLVTTGPERREVSYTVPNYFAGGLKIMAVAVAEDAIGAAETHCIVRGPFVLTPNVPTFAAPGDEFTASLTVANNLEGPNPPSNIALQLTASEHLEIIGSSAGDPRRRARQGSHHALSLEGARFPWWCGACLQGQRRRAGTGPTGLAQHPTRCALHDKRAERLLPAVEARRQSHPRSVSTLSKSGGHRFRTSHRPRTRIGGLSCRVSAWLLRAGHQPCHVATAARDGGRLSALIRLRRPDNSTPHSRSSTRDRTARAALAIGMIAPMAGWISSASMSLTFSPKPARQTSLCREPSLMEPGID